MLNGAPASISPNDFLAGLNADNTNEYVTVVMLSHVYALKVSEAVGPVYLCRLDTGGQFVRTVVLYVSQLLIQSYCIMRLWYLLYVRVVGYLWF